MKNYRVYYVAVGAFVVVTMAAFILSVVLLSGRRGEADRYYTVYDNVAGLKFGTLVSFEGYPIGQVEKISPFEEKGRHMFKVEFSVSKGWKMPKDSAANVVTAGLLAAASIDISNGKSPETLKPGDLVKGRASANMYALMADVAADVKEMTQGDIRHLMASLIKTVNMVNELVAGEGKTMLAEISGKAPVIVGNLEKFSVDLGATLAEVRRVLNPQNAGKVETALENIDRAAANLAKLSTDLQATRSDFDKLLASANPAVDQSAARLKYILDSTSRHIDAINDNLEGTSRNMLEFSRQIRENPAVLLSGKSPSDEAETHGGARASGGKKQ